MVMKVCKKCKTHVPNKSRICRNCGADVSKAKIIPTSNTKNNGTKRSKNTQKSSPKEKARNIDIKQKALETLNEDIKNTKTNTRKFDNLKTNLDKYTKKTNSKISQRKTVVISNFITNSVNSTKKLVGNISKKINRKNITKVTSGISTFTKKTLTRSKKIFKKGNLFFSKISLPLKNRKSDKPKKSKDKSKNKFLIKFPKKEKVKKEKNKEIKKEEKSVNLKEKKSKKKRDFNLVKNVFNNVRKSINLFIKKSGKYVGVLFAKIFKKTGSLFKKIGQGIYQLPKRIKPKKRVNYKRILVFLLLVLSALVLAVFGEHVYELIPNKKSEVTTEKATKAKVFSIGDAISYKGAEYKVTKIEVSQGNSYKSPKEGNQFLIVKISIKNNSDKKLAYSYENWTMSNSKGEEKKRIFTSINVEDALYSGELVIGGIKKGSMVFEQPINDPKLKMNFYELKKDESGNEEIDTSKRAFSVSIKVPEEKKEEPAQSNESKTDSKKEEQQNETKKQ